MAFASVTAHTALPLLSARVLLFFSLLTDNGQANRFCTVSGTEQMVRLAREYIQDIIREAEQREVSRRGDRGFGGGGPPRDMGPPPGGAKEEVPVPADCTGRIIGRGGYPARVGVGMTGSPVSGSLSPSLVRW